MSQLIWFTVICILKMSQRKEQWQRVEVIEQRLHEVELEAAQLKKEKEALAVAKPTQIGPLYKTAVEESGHIYKHAKMFLLKCCIGKREKN